MTMKAAAAAANISARPLHAPMFRAAAMITSESHSCAVQGLPVKVKEKGSVRGTDRAERIMFPAAICQLVSPSLKIAEDRASGRKMPADIAAIMTRGGSSCSGASAIRFRCSVFSKLVLPRRMRERVRGSWLTCC
jgi:hypothetical protein